MLTRIKALIKQGGVSELFRGCLRFVYWRSGLRTSYYTLAYRLRGSPVSCTIGNINAQFIASSGKEYARVRTLHGERTVVADLLTTLKDSDVVYDIGANVGTYSCFAGQQVADECVVAFEPHPTNVNRLDQNADLNDIDIIIQEVALSNESGVAELEISGSTEDAGAGTHSLSTGSQKKTINVEMIEGDKVIEKNDLLTPSVLKVDVEGAEQLVLEGLLSTLRDGHCHTVYCEIHPEKISEFGGSSDQVEQLLRDAGYSIKVLEYRSPEYFLKATLNT